MFADGFCLEEVRGGKQKGMRRRGPISGALNVADPATVEQRGFFIRFGLIAAWRAAWCGRCRDLEKPEKPLEWQSDVPGLDASLSTNRPPFRICQ